MSMIRPTAMPAKLRKAPPRPRKRLRAINPRKAPINALYAKLKRSWAKDHSICEYEGCGAKAMPQPHHKKGRLGKLLTDTTLWMALCWYHHRFTHDNPEMHYEKGYLIKRL